MGGECGGGKGWWSNPGKLAKVPGRLWLLRLRLLQSGASQTNAKKPNSFLVCLALKTGEGFGGPHH